MTAFIIGLVVISFLLCVQMCAVLYQDIKKLNKSKKVLFENLYAMNRMITELHDRLRDLEEKIDERN